MNRHANAYERLDRLLTALENETLQTSDRALVEEARLGDQRTDAIRNLVASCLAKHLADKPPQIPQLNARPEDAITHALQAKRLPLDREGRRRLLQILLGTQGSDATALGMAFRDANAKLSDDEIEALLQRVLRTRPASE